MCLLVSSPQMCGSASGPRRKAAQRELDVQLDLCGAHTVAGNHHIGCMSDWFHHKNGAGHK